MERDTITTEAISHCHANKNGMIIYVPTIMAQDSQFPFRPQDKILLVKKGKHLEVSRIDDADDNGGNS